MKKYLTATAYIDSDEEQLKAFAFEQCEGKLNKQAQAISLFYAVRDGFYYDPYQIDLTLAGLKASRTLALGYGWCVSKAILLAACCRAVNIPARLGFADVKNHLSTKKLREYMNTDVFYWHGYTAIFINGKWLKVTPAFNKELCEKFAIKVLDFDGKTDAIYHPFNLKGDAHMEYLKDRGQYSDLPLAEMMTTYKEKYSNFSEKIKMVGNFNKDIALEK